MKNKQKTTWVFFYIKYGKFEAFLQNIKLSANLLFLKSVVMIKIKKYFSDEIVFKKYSFQYLIHVWIVTILSLAPFIKLYYLYKATLLLSMFIIYSLVIAFVIKSWNMGMYVRHKLFLMTINTIEIFVLTFSMIFFTPRDMLCIVMHRRVGSGRFGRTVLTNSGNGQFWQRISELRTVRWPFFSIFLKGKVYFFPYKIRIQGFW